MKEPIGVLFDVFASISTPQAHLLLEQLQCDEANAIVIPANVRRIIERVEMRWKTISKPSCAHLGSTIRSTKRCSRRILPPSSRS
jgi:hypothetical protein